MPLNSYEDITPVSRIKLLARQSFSLSLILLASACGGGGGGSDTAPNPVVTQAGPFAVESISPLQGVSGQIVTITGNGLTDVLHVYMGNTELPLKVISDRKLEVTLITGAQSGPLNLYKSNTMVQTAQKITITEPQVQSISSTELNTGDLLTLNGNQLNLIKSVRLGGVILPALQQSASSYQVSIPDTARSGYLTIEDNTGRNQTLPQAIQIWRQLAQPELRPAAGIPGQTISLIGQGIEQTEQLLFTPNQLALIKSRAENRLDVEIPAGAQSGPLLLAWGKNTLTSNSRFEVTPLIRTSAMAPLSGPANTVVQITGQGLDSVSRATIGGVSSPITAKTATSLSLLASGNGEVILSGGGGQQVSAGFFNLIKSNIPAAKAVINLESVALVQNYSQLLGAQYQRLVPGKTTIVRANITTGAKLLASPKVWLNVSINGLPQGQPIPMTGPATVPGSVARNQLEQSFNANLPEQWIKPGLTLRIDADPEQQVSSGSSKSLNPVVGLPTNMDLVLVPLQLGDNGRGFPITAQSPSGNSVKTMLSRAFPLAGSTINVSIRNGYRLSTVLSTQDMKYISTTSTGSAGWNRALSELEQLRVREASERHYYGLVPDPNFSGGTAGLGYVNSRNSAQSSHSAIGLDATNDQDQSTMAHELGHNLSRYHAPCGGVGNPDPLFPYAGGKIGDTLPYDPQTRALLTLDENNNGDLMGYCGGNWFSDYNYSKIQNYLEQRSYPQAPLAGYSMPLNLIDISGSIRDGKISFNPVSLRSGKASAAGGGEYELHLILASGQPVIQRFAPVEIADGYQPEQHFFISLPQTGTVRALEIWHKGKLLGSSKPQTAAGAGAGMADFARLQWQERAGKLQISWNASQYPWLSVMHLGKTRQVLSNRSEGGQVVLDLSGVPAGGQFELSVSDGLNPRLIYIKRP